MHLHPHRHSPRQRIVAHVTLHGRDLTPHPLNPALHGAGQRDKLRATVDRVGLSRSLLIYDSPTLGPNVLIDGHMRAHEYPDQAWVCEKLDVDDDEARVLIAALDTIAKERETDPEQLAELLDGILRDTGSLLGTAHDQAALDALLESITPPDDDAWAEAFEALPDGDRPSVGQWGFMLHLEEQRPDVQRAIDHAAEIAEAHPENASRAGNALHHIALAYLRSVGMDLA